MMEIIDSKFNIPVLQDDLSKLLDRVPVDKNSQICLMHRENCNDPYYFGCGSLVRHDPLGEQVSFEKLRTVVQEEEFSIFNEDLKYTYFQTVYNEISKHFNIARLRVMLLKEKSCLSWHRDVDRRLHIPIVTNDKCRFVVEDNAFFLPADGSMYVIDTTKYHTVFNGSNEIRIHLVASIMK